MTTEEKNLIRQHIQALKAYVKAIEAIQAGKTLIKVTELKRLTGWETKEQLRRAREAGYVNQIKTENGIFYIKESIDPIHLKLRIA